MVDTKKCRQCGEIKPSKDFRPYYGGKSGSYSICRTCEKINSRAKYLNKKGDKRTEADETELAKINQLYELQRACGLKPPKRSSALKQRIDKLDTMLKQYSVDEVPEELQKWLTADLTEAPEVYDEVYDGLKARFMPLVRVDTRTLEREYDTTHAKTLNRILERFTEYEDNYYTEDN